MQAKPDAEVGSINGAVQTPLLRADQLIRGVMLAGIASEYVHEVIALDGAHVVIQRLPRVAQPAEHVHAYTLFENTTCACGLGRREVRALLPSNRNTPKLHVLVPVGPVETPLAWSVYLVMDPVTGLPRTMPVPGPNRGDVPTPVGTTDVPIMTRGLRIWDLPHAARTLLEQHIPAATLTEDRGE